MTDVPFLPAAREEFLEAVDYYAGDSATLGADFLAEVEHAVERIARFPNQGSPYLSGTRRVLLHRFPFSIVYEAKPDDLLIVAVAHQHRRPGYWLNRLS